MHGAGAERELICAWLCRYVLAARFRGWRTWHCEAGEKGATGA